MGLGDERVGRVGGKLNLAQDVTAPGNSDAAVWRKSRHDYGPQYVLPTVRESRGISQRRIPRRRRRRRCRCRQREASSCATT